MEQKTVVRPSSDILKYGVYLFVGMLVLGVGVYIYMWNTTKGIRRDVERLRQNPLDAERETDEQIEEKIREIQKYLLKHPSE